MKDLYTETWKDLGRHPGLMGGSLQPVKMSIVPERPSLSIEFLSKSWWQIIEIGKRTLTFVCPCKWPWPAKTVLRSKTELDAAPYFKLCHRATELKQCGSRAPVWLSWVKHRTLCFLCCAEAFLSWGSPKSSFLLSSLAFRDVSFKKLLWPRAKKVASCVL